MLHGRAPRREVVARSEVCATRCLEGAVYHRRVDTSPQLSKTIRPLFMNRPSHTMTINNGGRNKLCELSMAMNPM